MRKGFLEREPARSRRYHTAVDRVGVLVRDLKAEFLEAQSLSVLGPPVTASSRLPYLLNGHDNLNSVQTVQAQIIGEVRSGLDL